MTLLRNTLIQRLLSLVMLTSLLPGLAAPVFARPSVDTEAIQRWLLSRMGDSDDVVLSMALGAAASQSPKSVEQFVDAFVEVVSEAGFEARLRELLNDRGSERPLSALILDTRASLAPSPWTAAARLVQSEAKAVSSGRDGHPDRTQEPTVDREPVRPIPAQLVAEAGHTPAQGRLTSLQPNGP